MKKKIGYIIFIAAVLALCCIPSLGMLLPQQNGAGGNQTLARRPALRDTEGKFNLEYPAQMTRYLEDNYFMRQDMITAWSALNDQILCTSIADNVVRGMDGWLYFADTLDDYTGLDGMKDREFFAAARNLALMQEYCEGLGAQFLFTIAPNKNSLYPEYMPPLTRSGGGQNAAGLTTALAEQNIPYLDLFAAFRAQDKTLYFTQDSHWNSKGAALAADAICRELNRTSDYYKESFTPKMDHKGDLYNMLYPTGNRLELDWEYGGELLFTYDSPIRGPDNLTIMTTGTGDGSLVMFRDSFGNLLYPYLADHFAHALFSRSTYRVNLAQQQEADYVVLELVERNLPYLIQNIPVMPAPVRDKLPSVQMTDISCGLETETSNELEGFLLVTGTLPANGWDENSPIYLTSDAGWYEAFLLEDGGFGGYIPENVLDSLGVAFFHNGEVVQTAQ